MASNQSILRKINAKLKERRLSAAAASKKAGLSEDYIRNMKRGLTKSANVEALSNLAEALGCSLGYLLGIEPDTHDVMSVPRYGFRLGMGGGGIALSEDPDGQWPLDQNYARSARLENRDLISVEVEGDSMAPTLQSGDQVMVDKSDRNPARGGLFAIYDSETLVLKRIERIPDTDPAQVRLISDNSFHGDYDVLAESTVIIGRVVWFARRL